MANGAGHLARARLAGLVLGAGLALAGAAFAAPRLADAAAEAAARDIRGGQARRVIVQLVEDAAGSTASAGAASTGTPATPAAGESESQRRARRLAVKRALPGVLTQDLSELPLATLTLADADALDRLLADPDVETVFADLPVRLSLTQSLPLVGQAPVAAVMGRRGSGQAVAVIDTGVDYTRAEFGHCTAPGVPVATCRVIAAQEVAASDGALDAAGHGTRVAHAVLGVAPGADIVAVDVFTGTGAYSSDVLAGINWAVSVRADYHIGTINLSLGDGIERSSCTRTSTPYYTAVNSARSAGLVVVAASGNEGYASGLSAPACVTAALAVGAVYDADVGSAGWQLNRVDAATGAVTTTTCSDATTAADRITCFSSSGAALDLLAPGAWLTLAGTTTAGTSFAAPLVAGAAAVLRAEFATETVAQIEARLLSSSASITDVRNGLVRPRLDVLTAQGPPDNDALADAVVLSGSQAVATGWTYNATAQTGEPAHAGVAAQGSVWWRWTAPSSGTLTLDARSSANDPRLAVYTGDVIDALMLQAADGTADGEAGWLAMAVQAGEVYQIAVDRRDDAPGAVQFTLNASSLAYEADVSVQMAAPATVAVDTAFAVQVTVANAGPQPAHAATLVVGLPGGLQWQAWPTGCGLSGATLTCDLGTLAVGASTLWRFDALGTAAGAGDLVAEVSSPVPDVAASDNRAQAALTVTAATAGLPNEGDVPIPAWALGLLGAMAMGALRPRGRGATAAALRDC